MTGVLGRGILKNIRHGQRVERRRRFVMLRLQFERERPGENPVRLIARAEKVTVWTVYSVLRGRR